MDGWRLSGKAGAVHVEIDDIPVSDFQERAMADNVFLNVQILRAAAAGFVAYYHLQPMLSGIDELASVSFPAIGVDVFFVISGFVMFMSNKDMNKNTLSFLVMRLIRIVPLYWIATFTIVLFYMIGFRPNGLMIFNVDILLKSLFFIQSEFENGRHDLILSLGWTLIYELFFYGVFAATFVMRSRFSSFCAVSVVFAAFIGAGVAFPGLPRGIAYFTNPIIVEFLFGAGLALLVMEWRDRDVHLGRRSAVAAGCALVLALAAIFAIEMAEIGVPNSSRALLWGVPALLIVGGVVCLEYCGLALKARGALLLGAASYALYLFHPVIMQGMVKLFVWFAPVSGGAGVALVASAALVSALIGSVVIHLAIETPILDAGRRFVRRMDTFLVRARFGT